MKMRLKTKNRLRWNPEWGWFRFVRNKLKNPSRSVHLIFVGGFDGPLFYGLDSETRCSRLRDVVVIFQVTVFVVIIVVPIKRLGGESDSGFRVQY